MSVLRGYRQGLRVGIADFQIFWNLKTWCGGWMLRIVTSAFAWVLMGELLRSPSQEEYLLVGNAVAVGASAAVWASNASVWFRYDGTHPLIVVAPKSMLPVVVGRTSVWLFNGVATSLATFAVLVFAFDYRPTGAGAWAAPLVVVLVCASAFSFALFLGALIGRRARLRNFGLDLTGMAFMALCGVSVPVSFWPAPVQVFAGVLPLTHGLAAIRALLSGDSLTFVFEQVGLELLVAVVWLTISLLTADRLADAGRADGSIELA